MITERADRGRLQRGAPGLFVHLAVATGVVVRLAGWASQASLFAVFRGRPGFYETRWTVEVLNYLRDDHQKDVEIAVLATWLVLAVVGRWRPERAWDDRPAVSIAAPFTTPGILAASLSAQNLLILLRELSRSGRRSRPPSATPKKGWSASSREIARHSVDRGDENRAENVRRNLPLSCSAPAPVPPTRFRPR
jgi:hypothetical protein